MAQLQIVKGETRTLPKGQTYTVGLGWDPAQGKASVDLDVWVLRHHTSGLVEAIYWGNEDWWRPDLGHNGSGKPFIATPELDVIHQGDDLTGAESADGYDERVVIDVSKAPMSVNKYSMFVTKYYEGILGEATNIKCGVKEDGSGNEYVCPVADVGAFDVSMLVSVLDRSDAGWTVTNTSDGYADQMPDIAKTLGVAGFAA